MLTARLLGLLHDRICEGVRGWLSINKQLAGNTYGKTNQTLNRKDKLCMHAMFIFVFFAGEDIHDTSATTSTSRACEIHIELYSPCQQHICIRVTCTVAACHGN